VPSLLSSSWKAGILLLLDWAALIILQMCTHRFPPVCERLCMLACACRSLVEPRAPKTLSLTPLSLTPLAVSLSRSARLFPPVIFRAPVHRVLRLELHSPGEGLSFRLDD